MSGDPIGEISERLAVITLMLQEVQANFLTLGETSELFDQADIRKLTGAATVPGQVRWLEQRAIPHRVEFIGATTRRRIIVSRVHVREWLSRSQKPAASGGLNWGAVR